MIRSAVAEGGSHEPDIGVRLKLSEIDLASLHVLHYPDPRLRLKARPVTEFGPGLVALAARMFELMREAKGVGLAAPQVGVPLRLFVMNDTGQPEDDRVVCNPVISDAESPAEAEEGCLSLPGVLVQVRRPARVRIAAQDAEGREWSDVSDELRSRVWQHETDHLNGVLIIDKMSPSDRIATRKTLKALEDAFKAK